MTTNTATTKTEPAWLAAARQPRWTSEIAAQGVRAWEEEGGTQSAFMRKYGLPRERLRFWTRRREGKGGARAAMSFIPVVAPDEQGERGRGQGEVGGGESLPMPDCPRPELPGPLRRALLHCYSRPVLDVSHVGLHQLQRHVGLGRALPGRGSRAASWASFKCLAPRIQPRQDGEAQAHGKGVAMSHSVVPAWRNSEAVWCAPSQRKFSSRACRFHASPFVVRMQDPLFNSPFDMGTS